MFRFVALTQVGPFHKKVKDWPSKACSRQMDLLYFGQCFERIWQVTINVGEGKIEGLQVLELPNMTAQGGREIVQS
jgi:hypothetical protein